MILNLDMSTEIVDIAADDIHRQKQIIGDWPTTTKLVTNHYCTIMISVDDAGLLKDLPINKLATSLHGMFVLTTSPLVGPAILSAENPMDMIDLPGTWIDLVRALRAVVDD